MKLKYCTECAARLGKHSDTLYVCTNGHQIFNNPRAAASVVFISVQGRVLYAKRAKPPKKGMLDFPGGFLNFGEDAHMAAKRTVYSATGIGMRQVRLIDIALNVQEEAVSACNFVFVCTGWEGELNPAEDITELLWRPLELMKGKTFAWEYPGLYDKLKPIVQKVVAGQKGHIQ